MKNKFPVRAYLPLGALALSTLLGVTGCQTSRSSVVSNAAAVTVPAGMTTCALAVAVRGGFEPTPAQWNALYDKFSTELAARGLFLITDYRRADKIINIDFLPDPINPNSGTALISSIVPNKALSDPTAFPSYASYTPSAFNPLWSAFGAYGSSYDPYSNSRYDSGYYSSPVVTPPATTPKPGTPPPTTVPHKPFDPKDCPPGESPYRPPPSFVGNQPHHRGGERYTPPASTGPSYRTDGASTPSLASRDTSSSAATTTASAAPRERSWWRETFGSRDSSSTSSTRDPSRTYSSSDSSSSRWSRSGDSSSGSSSSSWHRSSDSGSSSSSGWSRSSDSGSSYSSSSGSGSSYSSSSSSFSSPSSSSSSSSSSNSDGGSRSTPTVSQAN